MNLKDRFVVLDIETTGITYEYFDEPTEIALVEIVDGKFTGVEKHFYLKPRKAVTKNFLSKVFGKDLIKKMGVKDFSTAKTNVEKSLRDNDFSKYTLEELNELTNEINHIQKMTDDMFSNISAGKSKYSILPLVREFIGDSVVIAHNAKFDVNFLNYWFNSFKLPLINKYICTLTNYKEHFGFKENNLGACCRYYGITLEGAHNALEDTKACAELFLKEITDFPNEINLFDFEEFESYSNFKKRVLNTNYCQFAKLVLSDSCELPINIESIGQVEIDHCKNLFFNFKKPVEVAKMTGLDLSSVEAIFIDWVNCININKHQDLLKDKYLAETVFEILKYCNSDNNNIKKCCQLLFDKDPNFFYFKLVDKLENKKDSMEYDLNDFEFYFINLRDLKSLSNKIGKDEFYVYSFLLKWINNDNSKFLKYKNLFKDNYNKPSGKKLFDAVEVSENKQYIFKQLGIVSL